MDKGYHLTGSTGVLLVLFSLCSFILIVCLCNKAVEHGLSYIEGYWGLFCTERCKFFYFLFILGWLCPFFVDALQTLYGLGKNLIFQCARLHTQYKGQSLCYIAKSIKNNVYKEA